MTSAQLHTNTNSKPIVSGEFALFSGLEQQIKDYDEALNRALEETLDAEKTHLTNTLSNHPDWADKSGNAKVSFTPEGVNYSVDHEDALDLEYGNPMRNVVATGVLRSTAKRRSYDVTKELMGRVAKRLS
jgi:hypothetical protein